MFFGVVYNAASGIASTVQGVILGFTHQILTAFRPQIIKLYASGARDESVEMIYRATKISSLLMVVITMPLCFQMDFILRLWLKTVPPSASIFCQFLLISACLNIMRAPLMVGIHATGRIKRMSFVTGTCYLIGVLVVWIGYRCGLAVEFAYLVTLVINLLLVIIVVNLLSRLVREFNFGNYFWKSVIPVVRVVCMSMIVIELLMIQDMNFSVISQIGQLLIIIIICSLLAFLFGINKEERRHIIKFVQSFNLK